MREYIKTQKLLGKLTITDKYVFENVRGEYQYDIYSNKKMNGKFEVTNLPLSFHNDFQSIDNFNFIGQGITLNGKIRGWTFGGDLNTIKFDVKDVTTHIFWENGIQNKLEISFYIPYATSLARDIKTNWGIEKEYIVKFDSDEFKLCIGNKIIEFYEFIGLVKHEEPDSIFHRMLYPKITVDLIKDEKIYEKLNELEYFMDDIMIIISFLLYHRMNSFGYEAKIYNSEKKIIHNIEHRYIKRSSGTDCIIEDNREFNNYFNSQNVSKIIESFIKLNDEQKKYFKRIIYSYLTIKELEIFEPQFKDTYYALEAISKVIVQPLNFISPENLIIDACEKANIDLSVIKFKPPLNSMNLKWLISEYRNNLTHFNFGIEFKFSDMINELNKMMYLLRSLMIYYLVPELKEFPYPENKYKLSK